MGLLDHPAFFSLKRTPVLGRTYSLIEKTNVFLFQRSQIVVKIGRESMSSNLIIRFDCIAEILVHASTWNGYKIMKIIVGE